MKLTKAQRYALAYYAAAQDGTPRPKTKRWDAKQSPRWDVVQRLRDMGLIDPYVLHVTAAGRAALGAP